MANNNENTFIIVLESSKIESFETLSAGKNYHFQDCKASKELTDSIQDYHFPHFFRTRVDSRSAFCIIRINQNRFHELEKIIKTLDGAIESIDWQKPNEIVAVNSDQKNVYDNQEGVFAIPDVDNRIQNLFFILFCGLILHDIWSGLIMFIIGILGLNKKQEDNQKWLLSGVFTILIGILSNSMIGNLANTKLGERTTEYYSWISNLQLIDVFTKNNSLPINRLLETFNIPLIYFYVGLVFAASCLFQLIKYITEITLNRKIFRTRFAILRFFWLGSIFLMVASAYIYFFLGLDNILIWIPGIIFTLLTITYQPRNKFINFLFGKYGVLELVKALFKAIISTSIAVLGISTFIVSGYINSIFETYLVEGLDFNRALAANIILQSLVSFCFCWIVFWWLKLIINLIK
jgi:hypothetical protein